LNLAWVEATARYWMRASLFGPCSRTLAFAVCIASAIAATAWVIAMPIFGLALVGAETDLPPADPLVYLWFMWVLLMASPTASAATWIAILALWALPLSARFWPVRRHAARWAFLGDPTAQQIANRPPVRLIGVVFAGLG